MHDLPVIELSLCAREEHIRGSDLRWLPRSTEHRVLAEALHLLSRTRGGLEGCVYGSGGNSVHALFERGARGLYEKVSRDEYDDLRFPSA